MSFDTVISTGNDSVYYHFLKLSDSYIISDSCFFWGGNECIQQNVSEWAGNKIIHNNSDLYTFFNLNKDSLIFHFSADMQDTALFYQDNTQKLFTVYKKSDTLTVLNNPDSARYYTIIHTDQNGDTISSPLNQYDIIIAKNHGLTQFFQIDSFPQILKPITLIGNISPAGGLFALTNEIIYDYQPGDEIQYYQYYHQSGGPPWNNFGKFVKHTILSKTLTADSLFYEVATEMFYTDSAQLVKDTIFIKFLRNETLAVIPFEKFDGSTKTLMLTDYCGINLWTYSENSFNSMIFCAYDTCWGSMDTGGPPPYTTKKYVAGLGMYYQVASVFSPPPVGYTTGSNIVYFKKNGIPCGQESFSGITEEENMTPSVNIFPNPAQDEIQITSTDQLQLLTLFSLNGQRMFSAPLNSTTSTLNISHLADGMYFAQILLNDNTLIVKKICVLKY